MIFTSKHLYEIDELEIDLNSILKCHCNEKTTMVVKITIIKSQNKKSVIQTKMVDHRKKPSMVTLHVGSSLFLIIFMSKRFMSTIVISPKFFNLPSFNEF